MGDFSVSDSEIKTRKRLWEKLPKSEQEELVKSMTGEKELDEERERYFNSNLGLKYYTVEKSSYGLKR